MTDYAFSIENAKAEAVDAYAVGAASAPMPWESFVDFRTDDTAALRLAPITAVGRIPEWAGGDRPQTRARALEPLVIQYTKYALQARVDKFDLRDLPRIAGDISRRFGIAVPMTYGYIAAELFAAAFTTATTSYDGLSLLNTAHTTKVSGTTRSNRIGSALDRTALMSVILKMRKWIDYEGLSYDLVAQPGTLYLVVPPDLEEVAIETVQSALSGADMAVNVAGMYGIQVVVWSLLSSTTEWFVCHSAELPVKFWERSAPDVEVVASDTDSGELKINVDFAVACKAGPTPDGIFGSKP